jgi:hypothetical protein
LQQVVIKIGKRIFFIYFSSYFKCFREEWITAIEIINRKTTPHLQHQLPSINMVTNDDIDNTENEYPAMNEIFTRRPVRLRMIEKSILVILLANQ